ncbi:hypothetical protein KQI38_04035 [Tissierella carlieri]|uniref:Uncharacterized protein n=1 Tax=Tissierella carlieri TaxID=689904 RepID=A0ABT1SB20_9FIRM|nr:hypothetical protein [Tissierella carlieri]MBU5311186.1 hypothetical protein [Tissierella carlieri]MCQ4923696.1 hypothetical protein [Tissierella carlieri]
MSNKIGNLMDFRKKHRRTISLIITILIVGYFIFKRFFYNYYEEYLGNDFIFYIITMIVGLDLIFEIIVRYYKKRKPN